MRLAVALAFLLLLPAQAFAETSPGVSVVGSIPERGVISARAVGSYLYVSALTGVSIYDVSDPRAPVRVGRLELPNAQNEDVDVGSGLMLVSDDPFGGRGILHVIDVRDPASPRLLSTYSTWVPGMFDLDSPPRRGGIGHTATCIQQCRYVWLAGSDAGIEVVDLRDPEHPRRAGRFRAREAAGAMGTHDVQVDGSGLAWVAGGNGTAAYDASDPVHPKLVWRTNRQGSRPPLNKLIHHNSVRLSRRVVAITEEAFSRGCRRAGTLQTWRIVRGGRLRPLDTFGVERDPSARTLCSAHYFDARDGLIAQGFYEQGVRLVDARRPRALRQVGYYVNRPGLFWGALFAPTDPTGSTVYALDHSRGIDVLALDRAALRPVRRSGSRPRGRLKLGADMGILTASEAVRPGQRLRLGLFVVGTHGPVDVQVTLPPGLVDVRVPSGVSFDPATRILRYTVRRPKRGDTRVVRARVADTAELGTVLETIGYVSVPDDVLPLDDRSVNRMVVARRASRARISASAAEARPWRGFCALR
jgi:LVIVD repeat-containing protein